MRIGKKLTLGYMLVALLVAVVGFLGLNAIRAISHPFDDVSRHSVPTIQTVEGLRFAGLTIVSSTSEWALMRSESEARILQRKTTNDKGQKPEAEEEEQIQSGRHMYDTLLKRYEELLQDEKETSEDKVLLERIRISGQQLQNNSAQLIELKKARVTGQAILEKKEDLEIAEKNFLDAVDAAIRLENSEVESDIATVESRIKAAINTISACGVLTLIVALVTGVWMAGSISKPLTRMKRASAEIGKGKLDSRLKVNSNDEIGELAEAFNRMAADLKRSNTEIVSAKNFAANIVRSMADTLIVADTRLFITRVNQATLSLLGYEEDDLIGKPLETVVADLVFGDGGIDGLKEAGFSSGVEKTYTRKDGAKVPMLFSGSVLKDEDCEVQGIVCVAHCIAERKQVDDALRRSEEHFRSLIENASDIITITDLDGTISYESPSIARLLGYIPEELVGRNVVEFIHPEDAAAAAALLREVASESGIASASLEFRFKHRSGAWRTLEAVGRFYRDDSGAAKAIINSRDVTERKKHEREILFTNTILNTEHETSLDGILVVGENEEMISFNKNFVEMWGIPDDVVRSRSDSLALQSVLDRLESPDEFLNVVKQLYANKEQKLRNELKLKDGRIFDRYSAPMCGADGKYYGRVFYFRDVTEGKRSEAALRESEENYRTILQSIQEGYFEVDLLGTLTFFNDSLSRIIGIPAERMQGLNHREYTDPKTASTVYQAYNGVFRTGEPIEGLRYEIVRPDGVKKFLETSVSLRRDSTGQISGFRGTVRDVTESRRVGEALRESEDRYRDLVEHSRDLMCTHDLEGRILSVNQWAARALGYEVEAVLKMNLRDLLVAEFRSEFEQYLHAVRTQGVAEGFMKIQTITGEARVIEYTNTLRTEGVAEPIVRGMARDITERKRSEAALRESEEKYRTILESIQEGYYEVDLRGHLTFFNDSLCRIVGTPPDKLKGLNHREYTDPETARTVFEAFNRVFCTGEPIEGLQYQITDLDGVTRFLELSVSLRRESTGEIAGFRGTIRDVTERQQAEQALRESQERYKTLFESATDAIMVLGTEDGRMGRILAANAAAAEHTGYTVEELMNLSVTDLQMPEQAELTSREIPRIVQGEHLCIELLRRRKDGTTFPIESNAGPLTLGGKRYILSFARDLTQRKQIEKEATMLAHAVRSIQEAVCITDAKDILLFVNDAFLKTYGYERHEVLGKNIFELVRLPANSAHDTAAIPPPNLTTRWEGELLNRRKDGTVFPMHLSTSPIFDETGRTIALVGVTQDITERKQADQALRESEKRYRALFESNPQPMWVYSTETLSFLAVNDAAVDSYGYSREEFLAMSIKDIRPQEDVRALLQSVENAPPGFESAGSWRHRKKDGSIIDVEVSSHGLSFGGHKARLGLATDITERKRATKELRDSELKYRTLFNHIADPVVIFDKATKRFLDCNEAVRRNYGYSVEELRTMSVFDLHPPEDLPKVERYIEVRNPDHPNTYTHITKDGRRIDVEILTDEIEYQGRPCCISIVRDITQRKRTEDKLLRLATAVEQTGDMIVITNAEGNIQYVNPAFEQTTGYSSDEAIGKNPRILKSGQSSVEFYRNLWETITSGVQWSGYLTNKRKDGSLYEEEATISPVRDVAGKIVNYVAVKRDITERRKMEKEVTMLAHAIRSIHDTVSITDTDDAILFVNDAFVKTYGYERDEVIGKNIRQLVRPPNESRNSAMPSPQGMVAERWEGELVNRRKDGTEFPVQLSASPIRDEDGRTIALIGVAQDITERKNAIEDLKKAKEAAEAASGAKSEFLANMSHEIRTPMNGIIGMTELALDTELTTEQREYLKMVKLSADSLLGVINDVLDFSKIEAGRLELDPAEFNLQDAVDEVMKALAVRADQKGLELAYYLRPGVPERVVGDVGRLRQVLVNLVGNAIKFTARGEVIVRVEAEAQTSEEVVLHFGVRDTGIGIPLEKQTLIFESFTQADGSTTRKYGGTGLGLTISSQLVQMMGGEIWVESPVNLPSSYGTPGSIFQFTGTFGLPLDSVSNALPPEMFDLEGLPVLVVDDNATNRRILKVQLSNWQMKPALVEGARSALRAIKDAASAGAPFRLALLDFHMPEMDGLALAEQIKSAPEGRDLRIIMMSSSVQQNQASPRDCSVDASLLKPVKAAELLSVIRVVLGADARSQTQRRQAGRKSAYPSRVLVAEDSTINQELIRRLLEKWGHTAVVAKDGLKALSLFDNERFDLVLMDLQMPEMNGFEVTAAIRQREHGAGTRIPIIALTAHALKGDRERCIGAGMDDYVSKPVDAGRLFDAVETAAIRRGSARSNCEIVPKALDLDGLMRNFDGDSGLVLTLARVFADSSLSQVEQIGDAIARGDAEALASGAHLLKGSVANFGARAAVDAAVQLEGIAKSGDLSIAGSALATLEKEIDRLKRELQMFEQASLL